VTRMNMKDSSKQPLLCNDKKPDSSTHIMKFTDIDGPDFASQKLHLQE
ncbi:27263_t:CDS:2, partial [Racocetra persica]